MRNTIKDVTSLHLVKEDSVWKKIFNSIIFAVLFGLLIGFFSGLDNSSLSTGKDVFFRSAIALFFMIIAGKSLKK